MGKYIMNNYLEFYLKLIKKNSIVVFYELNLEENYNFFNEYKEYFIQNQNVFINISSQNNYKNLAEFFINVKTLQEVIHHDNEKENTLNRR